MANREVTYKIRSQHSGVGGSWHNKGVKVEKRTNERAKTHGLPCTAEGGTGKRICEPKSRPVGLILNLVMYSHTSAGGIPPVADLSDVEVLVRNNLC